MEFQSRARSYLIPETEDAPHKVPQDAYDIRGNEGEKPVSKLQRRHSEIKVYKEFCDFYARSNMANALANAICERCRGGFAPAEKIVNSNGELYHEQCFVCAQCFQQFPEGLFYEVNRLIYFSLDFLGFLFKVHRISDGQKPPRLSPSIVGITLSKKTQTILGVGDRPKIDLDQDFILFNILVFYLPAGEFIIGRVIKAMNNSWHPECFCCDICQQVLADIGFVKNAGRHLCRPCHNREKARGLGKYICQKCHAIIDEQPLIFKNDPYHPDHFNCANCGKELSADARELKGELYCLPCHDKMGVPICGACRRPIEGRVVNAMGKQWHVEHFVCAKCEKPFLGHRHYERKGLAYCETHYNQLFGDVCFHCNRVIEGDVVSALNKAWCVNCFSCSTCNTKLTLKNKFVEFDMKPVCKKCYEKFPLELKKRLKKLAETLGRK
ncbi:PREDICTED: LIM and senescent cell antigen-like-containing domain protein 2 [Crocodylus porosus]|uniref:LIM and senescent cell antigen-like-containing domain protein 2 n=1 Tax=Crocodylus porosus TaxID=8502 RepID=UPI00093C76FF|nr:PREDICTED: LIM and senescent cell antigen-like-containing domain protein 2 [Crocodylus porosus]